MTTNILIPGELYSVHQIQAWYSIFGVWKKPDILGLPDSIATVEIPIDSILLFLGDKNTQKCYDLSKSCSYGPPLWWLSEAGEFFCQEEDLHCLRIEHIKT